MKKIYLILIGLCLAFPSFSQITVTSAIVPQYMQGVAGTNNNRTPVFFWVELANLTPNATYRYYSALDTMGAATTSNGAGVIWLINPVSQTFRRSSTASLSNSAQHDSVVASASGTWSGWMGVEPSGNNRFTPGFTVYPKIMFNNGAGGTAVSQRLFLTSYPITVINYGNTASNIQGSFFFDSTTVAPKSFAGLFDNTSATGRPLSIAVVESDGVNVTGVTSILSAYRNNVDTLTHRWGTIVPNVLANGIRNIHYYNFTNATLADSVTDADGTWCWANTVNPTNGTTAIRIRSLEGIPAPVITNVSSNLCELDSILLIANGIGTISWFSPTPSSLLGTGDTLNAAASSVFFAQSDTNGCTSSFDTILFTIDTAAVYYADNDGDSYGDPNDSIILCAPIAGYVANSGDCDDNNNAVHPGATELCNGIDDNCDTQIDEGCSGGAPEFDFVYPTTMLSSGNITVDTVTHSLSITAHCPTLETFNFTIRNLGTDTLDITLPVTITSQTGMASTFTVVNQPDAFVAPGDTTVLGVNYTLMGMGGLDTVFLSIVHNDANENPYNFQINYWYGCGSVPTNSGIQQLKVYPQPATDFCFVDFETSMSGKASISVVDLTGKKVSTQNFTTVSGKNKIQIPVSQLSPGIYLLKIENGTETLYKKMIRK